MYVSIKQMLLDYFPLNMKCVLYSIYVIISFYLRLTQYYIYIHISYCMMMNMCVLEGKWGRKIKQNSFYFETSGKIMTYGY